MTREPVERFVLIGMMGAGKSTVGQLLATRLGWSYIDNDADVRALTELEPPEVIWVAGEEALHAAEAAAFLGAIEQQGPSVIAAAAWVIEDPTCADALRDEEHVVYLRARPETLRARIGIGEGRRHDATDPAWLQAKATERDPVYRELATLCIDVDDRTPAGIVELIRERFAG